MFVKLVEKFFNTKCSVLKLFPRFLNCLFFVALLWKYTNIFIPLWNRKLLLIRRKFITIAANISRHSSSQGKDDMMYYVDHQNELQFGVKDLNKLIVENICYVTNMAILLYLLICKDEAAILNSQNKISSHRKIYLMQ